MENKETLFIEFPGVSTREWEEKILQDLKGADYEKKLVWNTLEGIRVKPYYRNEHLKDKDFLEGRPGRYPFIRGSRQKNNSWEIRQDIQAGNITEANKKARFIVSRGVTALGFTFPVEKTINKAELKKLLKGIDPGKTGIHFNGILNPSEMIGYLIDYINDHGSDKNKISGSVNYDPLGDLLLTGNFKRSERDDFNVLVDMISLTRNELPDYKVLTVNGCHFSNAGSGIVQELAFSLSEAVEYISRLTVAGLKINYIFPAIQFVFGVGCNYFMEIAKIRAARYLWSKIIHAYHPSFIRDAAMYIHSVTSGWNKTIYDPYVNVLRATTESMSAIIGGTDSLYVHPFDSAFSKPSEFSERIARNTQIILKEEAYFDKVIDPAAGSYYIENLTSSIIEEAWKLFLEIEDLGGFHKGLLKGKIQDSIYQVARARVKNVADRKEVLIGTNKYANPEEIMSDQIDTAITDRHIKHNGTIIKPLHQGRVAEEIERLRLATERSGKQPVVFLLTIGNPIWRKARATFTGNFFACAGYRIIDNTGFTYVQEGIDAADSSGADIVVVCSSDNEYSGFIPEVVDQLRGKIIVVAGAPENKEELKQMGIDYFIHIKSNIVEELSRFNSILGI